MPQSYYNAPGAAVSDALEGFLVDRQAQRRQAMMDSLAFKREADLDAEKTAALQEKKAEALARLEEKERAQTEREVHDMVIGDVPSAELIARTKKYHVPMRTAIQADQEPVQAPAPKPIQELGGPTPVQTPTPMAIRFSGSPAQAKEQSDDRRQMAYIATLPKDSPERKALEYELNTGKTAPAGMFQKPTTDLEAIFQQNPRTGTVERMVDGQWVPWKGDVPKGAHFMTVPAPKDNSAGNAREDTRRDNNYKTAVAELDKAAQPISAQVASINDLGLMLNEKTPQADALIAPMVLKATVSGAGSGFRMTQAEINQVLGGRSKWETLSAALNKWATDPSQALSVTDEQRTELRSLAKAIRTKAVAKLRKITDTRHALDDAEGVDEIHRLMTKFQTDLFDQPEEGPAAGGLPTVGGTFNGGTVTKVTKIPAPK